MRGALVIGIVFKSVLVNFCSKINFMHDLFMDWVCFSVIPCFFYRKRKIVASRVALLNSAHDFVSRFRSISVRFVSQREIY
jgi:hypothetical protein